MEAKNINVNIDPLALLAPLIAAQLTNVLYTKAVLRQLEGKPSRNLLEDEFVGDVIKIWTSVWTALGPVIEARKNEQRPSSG